MEEHRVLAVEEGTEQDTVKSRKTKGRQKTPESRKKGMNRANLYASAGTSSLAFI